MKPIAGRLIVPLLLCLALPAAGAETAPAKPAPAADHVVLISIDGLRPEFYLDPAWPTPMLQQLVQQGAHAKQVRGVFPSVTYPSHTTMVTGVYPARHGIDYNAPFEPEGETGRWYWDEAAISATTLWDAAKAAGRKTAAIGWPVTVGAPIDFLLPEVWSVDGGDFIDVTRDATRPPGLFAELEREATGRLTLTSFSIDHMRRDDRAGDAAAYLLETYRPALLAVHLVETDHFQHEDGRESWRVRRAVAAVDRAVSKIYEAAERAGILPRTTFLITGDHGHVDLHTMLAPNALLRQAGLMGDSTSQRGDWRATFHTTGTAAFLHLRDPGDREALEQVRSLLAAQPKGLRELYRVLDRAALQALAAAPEAALALALEPGVNITASPTEPFVGPADGASHGYLPDACDDIYTGLVVSGAGIRQGAVAPKLRLIDVAPLIAHLLGLELPGVDGVMPAGFLEGPDEEN